MKKTKDYIETTLDAIYSIVTGSIALLTGNCYELSKAPKEESETLAEARKELVKYFFDLRELKSNTEDMTKEIMTDKCGELKRLIINCRMQLNVIEAIISKQSFMLIYSNTKKFESSMDENSLYQYKSALLTDIQIYLNNMENDGMENISKSQLMAHVPLIITRGLYGDYLTRSLTKMYSQLSEFDIDLYNKFLSFYVDFEKSGVPCYPGLSALAKELYEFNKYIDTDNCIAESSDTEKFDKLYNNLMLELTKEIDYLTLLFETANFLTILINYSIDFDSITKEVPVIRDLYFLLIENYEDGSLEEYSFGERIDECMSKAIDLINLRVEDLSKLFKRSKADKQSEAEKDLTITFKCVYRLFFERLSGLESVLYNVEKEDYSNITKERAQTLAGETVEMLQNSTSGMSARARKLNNRFLLNYIPCILEEKKLMKYIFDALKDAHETEILFTSSYLYDTLGLYQTEKN